MAKGEKKNKDKTNKKGITKNTRMLVIVIAAVVLLVGGLMAMIFLMPTCSDPNSVNPVEATYPTDANGREYAVDSKGNKIENDEGVSRDKNGKIVEDGVVQITTQGPLLVTKVEIENESGTYTILSETPTEKTTDAEGNEVEETQETIYTVVGFEDAQLQSGQAESIANQASNMASTEIIDISGKNLSDYGLDKPRAKVKTTFNDGTVVKMDIGNDAPSDLGTYIKYSDKTEVYLTGKDSVNAFFYSVLDLLNTEITDAASTEENAELKSLTLSGTNFPQEVTMVPNDDETCSAHYKLTKPEERFVNVVNGDNVKGSVRGLSALSVVAYHPSEDQLSKYGLSKPAATVEAEFNDNSYKLSASKADDSGNVYVYNHDTNIVYQVSDTKVAWATTSYEDLKYEYVLKPSEEKLSSIEITADGKTYKFGLEKVTKTDDEGNETSSTKITYGDKSIAESKFTTFFDNLTTVQRSGDGSGAKPSGKAVLTVKYNYNNGKASDTLTFYKAENRKMLVQVNGKSDTYVFETYTSKIIEDAPKIAKGETVTPM